MTIFQLKIPVKREVRQNKVGGWRATATTFLKPFFYIKTLNHTFLGMRCAYKNQGGNKRLFLTQMLLKLL